MITCPTPETLLRLQDGRLTQAEYGALEAHVETCPACQQRLDALSPGGESSLLPLLGKGQATLAEGEPGEAPPDGLPAVPGYALLGVLGEGGMGVVYRARHLALRRDVALKMLLAHKTSGPAHLVTLAARFQREAEAVARLQHPNIIQIFDVGRCEAGPYFAMEYVAGDSLARRLGGVPQDPHTSAALVEILARAMAYAHERGVVHRDLKPANVLIPLGREWEAKIADFGLAKQLDDDTGQTQTGAILGTPSYMAPEQASGGSADSGPPVDVYALGAVLYELLTGRPPFKGQTALDTLEQVRGQEPVPVRQLQPKVPRDLETVCLKCLQKEPHRRYAGATELADDLRRFRAGEPIAARPVGRLGRAWRWARRNPGLAGLGAAVALLVLAVAIGSTTAALLLVTANAEAGRARDDAVTKRTEAERAEGRARESAEREKKARLAEAAERKRADASAREARRHLSRLTVGQGLARLGESDLLAALPYLADGLAREAQDGEPDPLHRLRLGVVLHQRPRLAQLWAHGGVVSHVAFAPDGRVVLATCWDGTAGLWDADTGKAVARLQGHRGPVTHGAFSPDGRRVLTGGEDGTARLWDARTGAPLGQPLRLPVPVAHVAFSPGDGRLFLAAGGNKNSSETVRTIPGHDQLIPQFDAKGMPRPPLRIPGAPITQTVQPRGFARVWETETGKPVGKPLIQPGWINQAAFSPDGRRVVTAGGVVSGKSEARVWDLTEGKTLHRLAHRAPVQAAAFSPDGSRLATACGRWSGGAAEACLWDAVSGAPLCAPLLHPMQAFHASFSPDGALLLTACADGAARLWDGFSGAPVGAPLRHPEPLSTAAFSPDGRLVLTAGRDRTARLWDMTLGMSPTPLLRHASPLTAVAFSPQGQRVATACRDGTVRVWELAPPAPGPAPLGHPDGVTFAALTADGRRLLTGTGRRGFTVFSAGTREEVSEVPRTDALWLWDAATGKPLGPRLPHDGLPAPPALSPDGRLVLTVGRTEPAGRTDRPRVWLWEAATGKVVSSWPLAADVSAQAAAFTADGRALVAAVGRKQVRGKGKTEAVAEVLVLDGATGRAVAGPLPHPGGAAVAALSPDGRRLATVGADRMLRLWDAGTGAALGAPLAQPYAANVLRFGGDGSWLLAYSADRGGAPADVPRGDIDPEGNAVVSVWDLKAGKRVLLRHRGSVAHADFSPAGEAPGRRVVTAGEDGVARVWDAATGTAVGPPLEHRGRVNRAAFSRDGRYVVTAGDDHTARVWDATGGEPVAPPLPHPGRVLFAAFVPAPAGASGWRVITGASDGQARFWDLRPEGRPAAELVRLAEVLSGHRLDQAGGLVPLEPAALQAAWDELRAKRPAELGPAPRPQALAWHNGQARDAARLGSWFAAASHLDVLVSAAPKDGLLRLRRARAVLRLGRWERAADDAARALALGVRHESAWETLALAHLHQGDPARYRQLCATLRERFGGTTDPVTARAVARIAVLGPGGVAEGEGDWLVRLARLGARGAKGPDVVPGHLPGAALYRAGAWREAVRELEAVSRPAPEDELFLAMAHHRLGETDRARKRLEKVAGYVERVLKVTPEGSGPRPVLPASVAQYNGKRSLTVAREAAARGVAFERHLGLALLLGEARALIGDAK